jgi:hypothetical protein
MPKINLSRQIIDKHDIVGKTFGRWTILECKGSGYYNCQCSCGEIKLKVGTDVMHLRTTQCLRCRIKERQKFNTQRFKLGAGDSNE